jgi:signal transduction histidine kinase
MSVPVLDDIARQVFGRIPSVEGFPTNRGEAVMSALLSRIEILDEPGVILARQQARTIAKALGFPARDRFAIASAVTHAACEAVRHAGGAFVEFLLESEEDAVPSLLIRVIDRTSLDPDLLPGHRRDFEPASHWIDRFDVDALDGKTTTVSMARRLPERKLPLDPSLAARIAEELLGFHPLSPVAEILDQDLELLRSFAEIHGQEQQLIQVNMELEDCRKGVRALHLEFNERGIVLRRANELKSRFLSRVSHELRTPLASILGLARLLLGRADGDLEAEQERQVSFILRAAHDLSGLVNDLLDLARLEAGREQIHLSKVSVPEFFATLRGMFRPLVPANSAVVLIFEDPVDLPSLWTDEGKLTQVLRNFLSNALKFTESGEIRVKAGSGPDGSIVFSVIDTGLGIAPEDFDRVFEEFAQIDGPHQLPEKGTGLGLPLARNLAKVLGGRVEVQSDPGLGSSFTATIPIHFTGKTRLDDPIVP